MGGGPAGRPAARHVLPWPLAAEAGRQAGSRAGLLQSGGELATPGNPAWVGSRPISPQHPDPHYKAPVQLRDPFSPRTVPGDRLPRGETA